MIKPRSVSGAVPCPACILWFAGRMLCSWAAGLMLPLVWTWHGKRHIPDSCSLPVAMFIWERGLSSLGGACLCQDVWRALVLKLLSSATVQEGGKGRMEVPLAASRHHRSLPLFPELCWNGQVSCLTSCDMDRA